MNVVLRRMELKDIDRVTELVSSWQQKNQRNCSGASPMRSETAKTMTNKEEFLMSIVKMKYEIKKAELKDSYSVVVLVHKLLCELQKKNVDLNLEYLVEVCNMIISNDGNGIFIALDQGKEIGVITVVQSMAIYAGGQFGIINEFYVLPEYRSCGIGNLLIEETIKFGQSKEWHRIEVGAPNENDWQRTIDFYMRENFIPIGPRLKKYICS